MERFSLSGYFVVLIWILLQGFAFGEDPPWGMTRLGISFDEAGVPTCVNRANIRLADPGLIAAMSEEEFETAVEELPELSFNYDKGQEKKGAKRENCHRPYLPETIVNIYHEALRFHFPDRKDELVFVSAECRPGDKDQFNGVHWAFYCAWKSRLSTKTLAQAKNWKNSGMIVVLGQLINWEKGALTGGFPMNFCANSPLREILRKYNTVEEVGGKILIFPPFSLDQFPRITGKVVNSSMTTEVIFNSALDRIYREGYRSKGRLTLLSKEKSPSSSYSVRSWYLSAVEVEEQ